MITILADHYRYTAPPDGAVIAATVADYVPVRQRIRLALDQHTDLTVYVSDSVVLMWLSDFQHYPQRSVCWRSIDPAEDFTQLFGVSPSSPFTPELIMSLQLDTLTPPPQHTAVNPVSWILGERLGEIWRYAVPPRGHAAQLAAWVVCRTSSFGEALTPLLATQLEQWQGTDAVYKAFRALHLYEDATALFVRSALQRYDLQWRQNQSWGHLPVIDLTEHVQAAISVLRKYRGSIAAHWRQRFAEMNQSSELIDIALRQMSGLSEAELTELTAMLDRHPTRLDRRMFAAIGQRFDKLPAAGDILRELDHRIAPSTPISPESDWSTIQWLDWATQMYLPYFAWTVRTGQERSYQQECATQFSDWLYEQYPAWLNTEHTPVLLRQYRHMRALLNDNSDSVVMWLVVDGLTWWQGEMLRSACEQRGLHAQSHEAGVAVLPSITSISKRALVTGLSTIDIAQPTIAEAARVRLTKWGIHGHVGYSLPAALQALQEGDATRCYIVLFNMIDVLAHQTSSFTDDAGIRGYLSDLANTLGQMRDACVQQGRPFHVLIGSDHGSTLLPTSATGLPLPQTTQEIDDTWEPELPNRETHKPSTRAAVVTDPARLNVMERSHWYVLDRNRYQLDRNYLVPRGDHYIGRRPSGWTHGGLTPEEVIVPLMHLTPEPLSLQPLTLDLSGTLRTNQAATIAAIIVNPNRLPVDAVMLELSDGMTVPMIQRIEAVSRYELPIDFPAVVGTEAERTVRWRMRFRAAGITQVQDGQVTLHVRRLQTEDTSFDDFFTEN